MKTAIQKFNLFLTDAGVPTSLLFVMFELIIINSYTLHYLLTAHGNTFAIWVGAVIGSLTYSITTIVVMQQDGHKGLKIILPFLDSILFFLSVNLYTLEEYHNGTINYVALFASVLFSIFTGLITYSLGQMNHDKAKVETVPKTDYDRLISQLSESENQKLDLKINFNRQSEELKSKCAEIKVLEQKLTDYDILQSQLQESLDNAEKLELTILNEIDENEILRKELDDKQNEIVILNRRLTQFDDEYNELKKHFIKSERSRILKKNPENRTEDEKAILDEYKLSFEQFN